MKVRYALIERAAPGQPASEPATDVLDLDEQNSLMLLVLMFGNGLIDEFRGEGDCADAIGALRGLACGTGGARRSEPDAGLRERSRLYREGDECYVQGGGASPSLIFIDPLVRGPG